MKKVFVIACCSLFLLGCDSSRSNDLLEQRMHTTSSGVVREYAVPAISKLVLEGPIKLHLVSGSISTLTITATLEQYKHLRVYDESGSLHVELNKNLRDTDQSPIQVNLQVCGLESISASGSLSATIVLENSLALDLSGSSKVNLKGAGDHLKLVVGGSATLDATGYSVDNVSLNASGSFKIQLPVIRELRGKAFGSGTIMYQGNPSIELVKIGSVKLRH